MQMTVREFIGAIQKATMYTDPSTNVSVGLLRQIMTKVSEEELQMANEAWDKARTAQYAREVAQKLLDAGIPAEVIPVHDFGAEAIAEFNTRNNRTELEKLQSTNNYLCSIVENAYRKKFGKTTAEAFGDGDLWFEKAVAALEQAEHHQHEQLLTEVGKHVTAVIGNIQVMNPGIDLGLTSTDELLILLTNSVTNLKKDRDELRVAHHHCKNSVEKLTAEITVKDAAMADAAEQLRKRDNTEKLLKELNEVLSSQGSILRAVPLPEPFQIGDTVCHAAGQKAMTWKVRNVRAERGMQEIALEGCTAWFRAEDFRKV